MGEGGAEARPAHEGEEWACSRVEVGGLWWVEGLRGLRWVGELLEMVRCGGGGGWRFGDGRLVSRMGGGGLWCVWECGVCGL